MVLSNSNEIQTAIKELQIKFNAGKISSEDLRLKKEEIIACMTIVNGHEPARAEGMH